MSTGRVLNPRKWMQETCNQPQFFSHPSRFTWSKSTKSLAVRNQRHQSHDHRHELAPRGTEISVRKLDQPTFYYQFIVSVITDDKSKNSWSCHQNNLSDFFFLIYVFLLLVFKTNSAANRWSLNYLNANQILMCRSFCFDQKDPFGRKWHKERHTMTRRYFW